MAKSKVLLLGASGETGSSILNGLLEHNQNEIIALIRPSSSHKPIVSELKAKGVEIRLGDATDEIGALVPILKDIDIVISAIDAGSQLSQLNLVDASKRAGVKRFVPCAFITVAPPGGIMDLRDQKELVYQHIRKIWLPYTIIDVGYWYQISFPALPSGKIDYAMLRKGDTNMIGNGDVKTGITDLRDVGRYVALIVNDERTLNRFVFSFSEVLSQKKVFGMLEKISGEKIVPNVISVQQLETNISDSKAKLQVEPNEVMHKRILYTLEYMYSKYVRGDNTPEYAEYLGYLSAEEFYPDFKPIAFREFLEELLDGKVYRPYPVLNL